MARGIIVVGIDAGVASGLIAGLCGNHSSGEWRPSGSDIVGHETD